MVMVAVASIHQVFSQSTQSLQCLLLQSPSERAPAPLGGGAFVSFLSFRIRLKSVSPPNVFVETTALSIDTQEMLPRFRGT